MWTRVHLRSALHPIQGLTLNAALTYLDSEVTQGSNYSEFLVPTNFKGEPLPGGLAAQPASGQCSRRARIGGRNRVATLAWNGYRHLEIYYGVAGAGYVCHTINPRLFPDQIAFIINHAADRVLFIELCFV
jgi:AMP-binding enzyme